MEVFAGVVDDTSEGPTLIRREEMFARARMGSDSIPDILDEVEWDQRLMFRLGLRVFSGRLLDRLLSYRKRLVGGIEFSGLLGLGRR
jgi:hypothetical protein